MSSDTFGDRVRAMQHAPSHSLARSSSTDDETETAAAERLISYLRSTLTDSVEGRVPIQKLSDEETAVIESDDTSGFTVQPWIESQKHLDAASASLFGRRSLYLRGLLTVDEDPETGEPSLNITDELRFLADARGVGEAFILARAVQHGERTARNNVLQSQIGTFEEDIDTDGFHQLSACTYRAALHRLAEWALPNARPGGAEIQTQVAASRWPRWTVKQLGTDVRTVEINVFMSSPSEMSAADTWMVAYGNGTAVLAAPDGKSLQVTSTSASQLEQRLTEWVSTNLRVTV